MNKDELKYKNLIKKAELAGLGWGIKFTKKNGDSWATKYPNVNYRVGKIIEIPDAPQDGIDCGNGLHLGIDFVGAGNYSLPEKIFFCTYEKNDLCGEGSDKVRVRKLKVECVLPTWMGYGKNGKKILKGLNKKPNLEKLNPYKAVKLPSKQQIKTLFYKPWSKVRSKVWSKVGSEVWSEVWSEVGAKVGAKVRSKVGAKVGSEVGSEVWLEVGAKVRSKVRSKVGAKVRSKVWSKVWSEVGAKVVSEVGSEVGAEVWSKVWSEVVSEVGWQEELAAYWGVNFHFNLNISHWFFDFLKLGVMVVFVSGKLKIFGKNGKYLGEYDEKELQ